MWIKSPILRILTITQRVTQREIQYVNRGIYTTLHNFIIKGTFTCTGGVCLLLLELCSVLDKGNPQQNVHKTLPSFATRFTTTGGGLRPDIRLYALGVVSCKNHTSHYVRVTQARKSTRIRSLNDVLSLLSFTSPLDPLRSRVAPFTFFNRYTFVTHTRYTSYLHHVLSLVLTLLCHHVNSYIFSYLRIWTPTTTP